MNAKHDRPNQTLIINGLWLESWFTPDEAFATALTKGLARFASFLGARQLDGSGIAASFLGKHVVREFPD